MSKNQSAAIFGIAVIFSFALYAIFAREKTTNISSSITNSLGGTSDLLIATEANILCALGVGENCK